CEIHLALQGDPFVLGVPRVETRLKPWAEFCRHFGAGPSGRMLIAINTCAKQIPDTDLNAVRLLPKNPSAKIAGTDGHSINMSPDESIEDPARKKLRSLIPLSWMKKVSTQSLGRKRALPS
ncbi:MAG TPA: hypothetical protein VI114_09170, partial [Chthoniobacterales bacterium]